MLTKEVEGFVERFCIAVSPARIRPGGVCIPYPVRTGYVSRAIIYIWIRGWLDTCIQYAWANFGYGPT
jgi:hypothetical protein